MRKGKDKVINDNDKMLEEERCELEQLGDINSALIIKERQSTYELQEAHTELIKVTTYIFMIYFH